MKRSHAVLVIAESLVEPRFPDDPMKEASHILKRLERYGMLPPATIKNIQIKGVMYVNEQVNEWDDEDPEPNYGEP